MLEQLITKTTLCYGLPNVTFCPIEGILCLIFKWDLPPKTKPLRTVIKWDGNIIFKHRILTTLNLVVMEITFRGISGPEFQQNEEQKFVIKEEI